MSTTFNDGSPASFPSSSEIVSPLTLDQIKAHLRVDGDDEDALLESINIAAADQVERYCNRVMLQRTFTLRLDAFPGYRVPIELPEHPAASVTSIVYTTPAGVDTTIDASNYRLVTGPPRVFGQVEPVDGECWPSPGDVIDESGRVVITYVAGYAANIAAAADVPAPMKQAVLQLAATMFRLRESVANFAALEIPHGVKFLLSTFRTPTV